MSSYFHTNQYVLKCVTISETLRLIAFALFRNQSKPNLFFKAIQHQSYTKNNNN